MRILIVSNRKNKAVVDMLFQVSAYFASQGIDYATLDVSDLPDSAYVYEAAGKDVAERYGDACDLIVTLGGDGTIIHTARLATLLDAPILGVNMGHLGFLANTIEDGAIPLIADALAGELQAVRRMNLRIRVECFGDEDACADSLGESLEGTSAGSSTEPREFFAFNEIAIARGALGHIVDFDFSISGDKIASMRGDGIIVATATGSTAYALSAGGPLLGPSHRGMVVVPLAPHTLNSRAIVAEHHDVVEVSFEEGSHSASEVSLFVDGDALSFGQPIRSVVVEVGEQPTTLLTCNRESFYKQVSRTFFDHK